MPGSSSIYGKHFAGKMNSLDHHVEVKGTRKRESERLSSVMKCDSATPPVWNVLSDGYRRQALHQPTLAAVALAISYPLGISTRARIVIHRVMLAGLIALGLSGQVFCQTPAKGFEGSWQGLLEAGGTKLRVALIVTKSETGTYAGKFDSLDQGATIPMDTITVNTDAVRLEMKSVAIVFEGVLNQERTELTGTFTQRGQPFPLTFKRGEQATASEQTAAIPPKPDYSAPADAPYTAEEVVVKTPVGHTLAGTLTLPKSASRAQPVGAIVTVTGSGPQDRDEALGLPGFRPFRQMADSLARRGIAVLRMDDRGTGASGGSFKGATSADFAEDVRAGLAYLRTRPEIRADRLGVLGHSEGAVIAPMVAVKEPTLRALVLLAGVAEPARSALHFQIQNGYEHNTKLTPAERDSLIAAIPAKIDAMMAADPWMNFFLTYDPAATMRHLRIPVLILSGSRDQQAAPAQVALMAAAFKAAGNTNVTARVLPDLNHLLVHDTDGFPENYAKLPPPVMTDAGAVQIITDWLAQQLQ